MKLSVFTPEKKIVVDQEIQDVLVPGHKGELHILNGHSPLMTMLSTGILKWRFKGEQQYHTAVVSSGYCEVNPQGILVLAEFATPAEEIITDNLQQEAGELEKKLGTEFLNDDDWDETHRRLSEIKSTLSLASKK